ncbi:MAG: hypothetical protein WD425_02450, partial [Nitrospirales bacterium]
CSSRLFSATKERFRGELQFENGGGVRRSAGYGGSRENWKRIAQLMRQAGSRARKGARLPVAKQMREGKIFYCSSFRANRKRVATMIAPTLERKLNMSTQTTGTGTLCSYGLGTLEVRLMTVWLQLAQ